MAENWPPAGIVWPPVELNTTRLEFSSISVGISYLTKKGFTWRQPTPAENQLYFKQVKCDHGDPCDGIIIVSPLGAIYPHAYCSGANHHSVLVLWNVSHDPANPSYDLGYNTGELPI